MYVKYFYPFLFSLFVVLVLEDGENEEWAERGQPWSQIQRTEFQEMDEDKDGYLTRDELLVCRLFHPFDCNTEVYFRMHTIH